jgi:RHS repeat-associated protein
MNCKLANFEDPHALVGDPVNVITGANVDRALDLQMPGPIHLQWLRHYDSSLCGTRYSLGWGHTHDYDRRLIFDTDGVRYLGPLGAVVGFPAPEVDGQMLTAASLTLHRLNERLYRIYQPDSPAMEFEYHDQLAVPISRLVQGDASLTFYYDRDGRLEELRDSSSCRIYVSYRADGCIGELSLLGEGTRSSRALLSYRYDPTGNLVWARDPYANVFTFGYDDNNRMISRTDRRGYSFLFEYDGQGRCIRATGEDGLLDTRLQYLVQEEITIVTKADGGTWTYLHPGGKVIRIIDPYGGSRELVRDPSGKLLEEIDENQNVSKIIYGKGSARLGTLSALGIFSANENGLPPAAAPHPMPDCPLEWEWGHLLDRSTIKPPQPGDPVLHQFGTAARLVQTADQLQTPQRQFDDFGQLIHETHFRGAPRRWIYDANGNTQRYYDHDGRQFRFEYASSDLRTSKLDPLGQTTSYEYTSYEKLAAIADPGGARTEYGYDLKGQLIEVRRHGAVRERYRYDQAGNLVEKLDRDCLPLVSIEIGPHNLKKTRTLASGDVHSFTYTEKGQFASASTSDTVTEFACDQFSNRTRDQRDGRGVEHVFEGPGKLKQTIVLKKFCTAYNSLPSGALVILDPAGNRHSLRKLDGGLIQRTLSNRTSELSQFDPDGRCVLKLLFMKGSRDAAWSRNYCYSGEGDLLSVEDNRRGTTRYDYDAAHRISNVQSLRSAISRESKYLFDCAGNLLAQPGLTGVTLLEGNRLLTANGDCFEHNHRNHISLRQGRGGETKFVYDSRDMLVQCESPAGLWSAAYDPLGRRIRKTMGESTTEFFWDTDRLIAEVAPDGRLRVYVYADAFALTPLLFIDYESVESDPGSGAAHFIFADHLGAPARVENTRGDVVWEAEYDPYGAIRIDNRSSIELNLRWPGHYCDPELGLHYNRFRYYSPELGRYLQSDPLGLAGGENLYAYTINPLKWVDLRGTCPDEPADENPNSSNQKPKQDGADKETPPATGAGSPAGQPDIREVDPATLRWSQTSAGGRGRADAIRASMAKNGWAGDPIDVVETPDGLATVDHTRAAVALEQNIPKIPVNVHQPDDPLPPDMANRPWDRDGTTASTWGEALQTRGAGQDPPIGPTGSPDPPRLPRSKS